MKKFKYTILFLFTLSLFFSCSDNDNNTPVLPGEPSGEHYVQLFNGDNFGEGSIIIDQAGEYSDLSEIAGKDLSNKANSFIVGDSTTVTMWTKTNFQGDSVVYEGGKYSDIDQPFSMKIVFGPNDAGNTNKPDSCYIQLFDGNNFKDDSLIVEGAGEYSDLSDLPGADGKDWTDEADSFIVGEGTTVTVWTQTNFQGDSTVYQAGKHATVDEPYSMKITCGQDQNEGNDSADDGDHQENTIEGCYIQLFDGDNFKDDSLKVKGPAEYTTLSDLPDADGRDWTDEADSFKVNEGTEVTVWTQTDFKGDSTVYEEGNYESVEEPFSMKIKCEDDNK